MAKVLIVDDSRTMRMKIKDILQSGGHTVVGEAANGAEAIELYEKTKPDIVTMDILMPEVNGVNAVESIVKKNPDANVVMVSNIYQRSLLIDALKVGAKDYIMKPVNEEKFLASIAEILKGNDKKEEKTNVEKPFEMSIRDNKFVVTIKGELFENDFFAIQKTLEGIFIVKDLEVLVELVSKKSMNEDILEKIVEFLKYMLKFDIKVSVYTKKMTIKSKICRHGLEHLLLTH